MEQVTDHTDKQNEERPDASSFWTGAVGFIVVSSIFFGLGTWAVFAPLAKAIPAAAKLSVKGERKQVQHFEGGIVASVHVAAGDTVKKNQLLLKLDPLQANANAERFRGQMTQLLARQARLNAEIQENTTITFEGKLLDWAASDEAVLEIMEAEQSLFKARLETYNGHLTILQQRVQQLDNEIGGYEIQKESRLQQLKIFEEEIIGLRELYEKGFYPRSKILAMERAIVELRGAFGNDMAQIARLKNSQGEARNQIVSVKQRFREDVVGDLRDIQAQLKDLEERVVVANDILQRVEIRAPIAGIIQSMTVHTVGGVISPGAVLMEIAPKDADLVVEADISPTHIDSIMTGQKAEVRLTALNLRTTPKIIGEVKSVSGDVLVNQTNGQAFFRSRIEIDKSERAKLGDIKLTAGMPAEVLIQTGNRTAMEYLLKPMTDALVRGLNED